MVLTMGSAVSVLDHGPFTPSATTLPAQTDLLALHRQAIDDPQSLYTSSFEILEPYGDLIFFTIIAFWDRRLPWLGSLVKLTPIVLPEFRIPSSARQFLRFREIKSRLVGFDKTLAQPPKHSEDATVFNDAAVRPTKPIFDFIRLCPSSTPTSVSEALSSHQSPLSTTTSITSWPTSSAASDGPGHAQRPTSSDIHKHGDPAGHRRTDKEPYRRDLGWKLPPDGDDGPPSGPPPFGNSKSRQTLRRRRKQYVRCPYGHTAAGSTNEHCSKKRLQISFLRVHLKKHRFFFCKTCLNTFGTIQEQQAHEDEGCAFKCVTRGCPNEGQYPKDTTIQCNHTRNKNAKRFLYHELCRLVQQRDNLEYSCVGMPDVEVLDDDHAEEQVTDSEIDIETEAVSPLPTLQQPRRPPPRRPGLGTQPPPSGPIHGLNQTNFLPYPQIPTASPLSARLLELVDLVQEVERAPRTVLDDAAHVAVSTIEHAIQLCSTQLRRRLQQTTSRREWASSRFNPANHPILQGRPSFANTHPQQPQEQTTAQDNHPQMPESPFNAFDAPSNETQDITQTGTAFPATPVNARGQVTYPPAISPGLPTDNVDPNVDVLPMFSWRVDDFDASRCNPLG